MSYIKGVLIHHLGKTHYFSTYNEFESFKFENSILEDYYFVSDGVRLVDLESIKNARNGEYWLIPRLRGGIDMDAIFDPVLSVLDIVLGPIATPVKTIVVVFIFLIKLIIWFGQFLIWMVQFILFLVDVLVEIPKDFFKSILAITASVLLAIPQTVINIMKVTSNTFMKYVVSGFWGWDKVPNSSDDYNKGKYWSKHKGDDKGKCHVAEDGRIPFTVLMGTIVMPPIGVFMTLGLTGWFHILICTLLTLAFYFPGLIYGLMIVYA